MPMSMDQNKPDKEQISKSRENIDKLFHDTLFDLFGFTEEAYEFVLRAVRSKIGMTTFYNHVRGLDTNTVQHVAKAIDAARRGPSRAKEEPMSSPEMIEGKKMRFINYLINEVSDLEVGRQMSSMFDYGGKPMPRSPAQRARVMAMQYKDEKGMDSDNPEIARLNDQINMQKQKLAKLMGMKEKEMQRIEALKARNPGQPGQVPTAGGPTRPTGGVAGGGAY